MTEQCEALRLADALDCLFFGRDARQAAAELRRLVEENQRLRGIVPEVLERLNDELCEENEQLKSQRDALLAILRESLRHAEWQDKHIHPFDGETFQNWMLSIYLPVRLSETDKSPEAALNRVIDAAISAVKE